MRRALLGERHEDLQIPGCQVLTFPCLLLEKIIIKIAFSFRELAPGSTAVDSQYAIQIKGGSFSWGAEAEEENIDKKKGDKKEEDKKEDAKKEEAEAAYASSAEAKVFFF